MSHSHSKSPVHLWTLPSGEVVEIQSFRAEVGPYEAIVTGHADYWVWEVALNGREIEAGTTTSQEDAQEAALFAAELLLTPE